MSSLKGSVPILNEENRPMLDLLTALNQENKSAINTYIFTTYGNLGGGVVLSNLFRVMQNDRTPRDSALYAFSVLLDCDTGILTSLQKSIKKKGRCPKAYIPEIRRLLADHKKPITEEKHISFVQPVEELPEPLDDRVCVLDGKLDEISDESDEECRVHYVPKESPREELSEKFVALHISPFLLSDLSVELDPAIIKTHIRYNWKAQSDKSIEELTVDDCMNFVKGLEKTTKMLHRALPRAKTIMHFTLLLIHKSNAHENLPRIRYGLSLYCNKMAEYWFREEKGFDIASEYYLESIALRALGTSNSHYFNNTFIRSNIDFYVQTAIKKNLDYAEYSTYINETSVATNYLQLVTYLKQRKETVNDLSVAFCRLASIEKQSAVQLYEALPESSKADLLLGLQNMLTEQVEDLTTSIRIYQQQLNSLKTELKNLLNVGSTVEEIINTSKEFNPGNYRFLINTDESLLLEISKLIKMLIDYRSRSTYEAKRRIYNEFEYAYHEIIGNEKNNTRLFAEFLKGTLSKWYEIVSIDFKNLSKEIEPILTLAATDHNTFSHLLE